MESKPCEIFYRSPLWAIRPEAAGAVLRLRPYAGSEARAEISSGPSVVKNAPAKTLVIQIEGVLTKDGPGWFGTNYNTIQTAAERAISDPDIKRVILHIDSPGGEVTGLPETAAMLAQLAKVKPVHAMVEGDSASAAYWLTSQAKDITLTPSGEVGSVGVRMMHADISKMLENEGVAITELYSGEFKTEWSPYKPLSEEAKADMQARLSATHGDFIKAIAAGRAGRATLAIRRSRFGEGRMFSANDALAHGLIDNIQPSRDFYRAFAEPQSPSASGIKHARARLELERMRS